MTQNPGNIDIRFISVTRSEPLLERYYWRVWPEPRFDLMNEAAELLCGVHDFWVVWETI